MISYNYLNSTINNNFEEFIDFGKILGYVSKYKPTTKIYKTYLEK